MNGGLLGIDMDDDAMKDLDKIALHRGILIEYELNSFENKHPNSMQLFLEGIEGNSISVLAASLGGGSFEIQRINGFEVSIRGDHHIIVVESKGNNLLGIQAIIPEGVPISKSILGDQTIYLLESPFPLDTELVSTITKISGVVSVADARAIMPIVSGNEKDLPFTDLESLIAFGRDNNLTLGEIGLHYEMCRSGLDKMDIFTKMNDLMQIIQNSIQTGLKGTSYDDRILPQQSHLIKKAVDSGKLIKDTLFNTMIQYVAAIMEAKSSLEVIVANPTAGSCGTVGATLEAVAEKIKADHNQITLAYFAAGIVGAYFAMGPGFSAEEHGCQVECGASAGMAAAGVVELLGGSCEEGLGAASLAIQNMIGLICDPIADRVEAPCLGKNTSAAVNAYASATMSLAGFQHLIPLDQVIATVSRVSCQMPTCVKCTGLGGLAVTKAAQAIKEKLK
jgi:L-serine dehydratase